MAWFCAAPGARALNKAASCRANHVAIGPQLSMRRAESVTLGEPRKETAKRAARFETFFSKDSLPYFDTRPLQEILDEAEGAHVMFQPRADAISVLIWQSLHCVSACQMRDFEEGIATQRPRLHNAGIRLGDERAAHKQIPLWLQAVLLLSFWAAFLLLQVLLLAVQPTKPMCTLHLIAAKFTG